MERLVFEGRVEYRFEGKLHRVDGPAIEITGGSGMWWVENKIHRLDGQSSASREFTEWWVDGKRHRIDGPAIEHVSGYKEWWVDDKPHRTDGPAIIWANGDTVWKMKRKLVKKEDVKEYRKTNIVKSLLLARFLQRSDLQSVIEKVYF